MSAFTSSAASSFGAGRTEGVALGRLTFLPRLRGSHSAGVLTSTLGFFFAGSPFWLAASYVYPCINWLDNKSFDRGAHQGKTSGSTFFHLGRTERGITVDGHDAAENHADPLSFLSDLGLVGSFLRRQLLLVIYLQASQIFDEVASILRGK